MNRSSLAITTGLLFVLVLIFQSSKAQTPRESLLITHLVKGVNQPGAHTEDDVFLLVKIGKVDYTAELKTGKVISQRNTEMAGGGICGDYAEVSINPLDKNRQETTQGSGQVLKLSKGKWKMIALSEGDYACEKLKGIPKSVLACLQVECN